MCHDQPLTSGPLLKKPTLLQSNHQLPQAAPNLYSPPAPTLANSNASLANSDAFLDNSNASHVGPSLPQPSPSSQVPSLPPLNPGAHHRPTPMCHHGLPN
ncbi:hypothetical protein C0989_008516 [Termitomyces sp. Mn162]|nr:hypothetical protein C0989_008516 [Termitomyces sp. Mn162]